MDEIKERQENEVVALKSIYSNFFVDLREEQASHKTANHRERKANTPVQLLQNECFPIFKITLFPVNSQSQETLSEPFVQIDLKIKFTPEYPNE
jgi:hypothetical protein